MDRRQRRLIYYVAGLVLMVTLFTVAYTVAMSVFEGQSRSLYQSLLVVVETFTTVGYGEDAEAWTSPAMIALMVAMQFTGVFFIFMALPLFVAPWIESKLTTTPPSAIDDLADHVVITRLTPRTETLIDELGAKEVPYVVVEPERERADELHRDGLTVIHGDPEEGKTLDRAGVRSARALVLDVDDERNASVALTARQVCADGDLQIVSFAEQPGNERYHRYAGVDHVFTPRQLIGESLANKVTSSVSTEVGDAVEIGTDFEIVELPLQSGADLVGTRIADSGIRERTGVNVVGAWFEGEFVSPPSPEAVIDERTILLVAGREDQLERLKELTLSEHRGFRGETVMIAGYGEVGSTVQSTLTQAGLRCLVVDETSKPGVDVVGDATEPETFERAEIGEASTVILALADDTLAIFATLVIRELAPEIEIVARANETASVAKLYRAGADYVLALSTVSGRMLASTVLDEDVLSVDQQVEVVRHSVGTLAGRTIEEADVRARTGCTVLAIERDGAVLTDFDPSIQLEAGDEVIVAGPDAGITRFSGWVSGEEPAPDPTERVASTT